MARIPTFVFLAVGLLLVPLGGSAQDTKDSPPPLGTASFIPPESKNKEPLTPEVFVVRAAILNMSEIELSQLALQKTANPKLRQFASRVIQDHQTAQAKLKKIAADAKVALPGTVDEPRREQKEQLAEQVGNDFDRQYIDLMRAGHQEAAQLLQAAASTDRLTPAFQGYAKETLDIVMNHRNETDKLSQLHP